MSSPTPDLVNLAREVASTAHVMTGYLAIVSAVDPVACTVDIDTYGGGDHLDAVGFLGAAPEVGQTVLYVVFDKFGVVIGGEPDDTGELVSVATTDTPTVNLGGDGTVGSPLTADLSARMYGAYNQSAALPTNNTKIPFTTVVGGSDSTIATMTNGGITISKKGRYLVMAVFSVTTQEAQTAFAVFYTNIYLNGTSNALGSARGCSTYQASLNLVVPLDLNAGDVLEAWVSSAGTGTNPRINNCNIKVIYLGPTPS